jgi:putative tricarboxylic transport membrane protein
MRADSPAADRVAALVFFGLGAAMLAGGYTMDRLEIRQIHPASIPGLVPMILGAALMLCAALLWLGAPRAPRAPAGAAETASPRNLAIAAGLCCAYALVLVGHLPFFVATAVFVAAFVAAFRPSGRPALRHGLTAVGFGIAAAAAVSALFRYGFLVRLP